jgi:hypothetical protein
MTTRLLKMVAGASLGAALAGVLPAAVQANPQPQEWACTSSDAKDDMCKQRKIKKSLPDTANEARHLVSDAKFRVVEEEEEQGAIEYVLSLEDGDWLAGFAALPPLRWVDAAGLLPDGLCKSPPLIPAAKPAKPAKAGVSAYAHFVSERMPLHLEKGHYEYLDYHSLYIYPIDPATYGDKRAYCMTFAPIEGGSHNGAVHGDP